MKITSFVLAVPRSSAALPLPVRVSSPGTVLPDRATLWTGSHTRCCALGRRGLAIGVLFEGRTHKAIARSTEIVTCGDSSEAISRHLLETFWGAYTAIVRDPGNGSLSLLTDPSGLLPVYRYVGREHVIVTTDAAAIESGPNYDALAAHLLRPELRHRRTCLEGLEELPPGALVEVAASNQPPRQLWHATDHFPRGRVPRFEVAAEMLRSLSTAVLGSWASEFRRVGVAASGGVDSSLVCAALAAAGADFDCITVSTDDRSGDERRHARAVARRYGVQCIEQCFDAGLFDPRETASRGLPRPARRAFLAVLDRLLDNARTELGANIVLDGNMGDNLFCYLHSAAPIVDRLRVEGLSAGVATTLLDMCRITQCSIPTMLKATARRLRGGYSGDLWPRDTRLLASDITHAEDAPLTPWLAECGRARSGAHDHVRLLMHAQNHVLGITQPLRRFSPLASQPLVEFCLAMPSWLWTRGGKNRAIARAAFADSLPAEVVARTSKAGPDSFIRTAFADNRLLIRERLLEGLLATHGLIDRPALESALNIDEFGVDMLVDRIFDLLEAENWAQSWTA